MCIDVLKNTVLTVKEPLDHWNKIRSIRLKELIYKNKSDFPLQAQNG